MKFVQVQFYGSIGLYTYKTFGRTANRGDMAVVNVAGIYKIGEIRESFEHNPSHLPAKDLKTLVCVFSSVQYEAEVQDAKDRGAQIEALERLSAAKAKIAEVRKHLTKAEGDEYERLMS